MSSSHSLTFREQMKGFPAWQMTVVCLIRFAEPITFTSFFPYIYFMVRDFGIAKEEADIARYSGFLAATFAVCQFLVCVRWGAIADKYGRKVVIMCGLAGSGVAALSFGFSSSYWLALAARSFMGLSNGNVAVIRTIIGEIATERRHQAMAFSTLPLIWSIGSVVGPMIGGSKYLTRPREDPSPLAAAAHRVLSGTSFYERFITKYPYALSNVVVAFLSFFSLGVSFLFLEETHRRLRKKRDYGLDLGDRIRAALGFVTPVRPWHRASGEATPLIRKTVPQDAIDDDDNDSIASYDGLLSPAVSESIIRRYSANDLSRVSTAAESVVFDPKDAWSTPVLNTIVASFMMAFHNIIYNEFMPVLLAGPLLVGEISFPWTVTGGFGYHTPEIGRFLSATGLAGSLSVLLLFPYLDRKFKSVHAFRAGVVVFPFLYAIIPYLVFTKSEYSSFFAPWATKTALYTVAIVYAVAINIAFPNVVILTHRAAKPDHRSYINGQAIRLSSLARFMGPVAFGYISSLSERYSKLQFAWFFLSFISLLCVAQSMFMEDYDEDMHDVQRVAATEEDDVVV